MTPDTAGSAGQDRITATAAQPLAIYVDGEGDPWMGNEDGTLSAMEAVADDDRYANWPVETVEGLFKGLTKVWSP